MNRRPPGSTRTCTPFPSTTLFRSVGNTWRIQMIKTLKAYAEQPDVAPMIEELKVVSTGTDVAAQVAAIDNFINAGYDAILTIAVNPTAFEPVIRREIGRAHV